MLNLSDVVVGSEEPSRLRRARHRILGLVLQAAHREGLLGPVTAENGELSWGTLKVRGRLWALGNRLDLERDFSAPLDAELGPFQALLDLIGRLAECRGERPQDSPWTELRQELSSATMNQSAAYAAAEVGEEPRSFEGFESWTPEGHNLHPGAKTRMGFSIADQVSYAPDFTSTIQLPWISVDKSLLTVSGDVPEIFDEGDRWVVPVHPWQRKNVLPEAYAAEWKSGAIADSGRPSLDVAVTTSLRTVIPENVFFPILKLSVSALMTSTERSMSRHTVMQGPLYSEYLRRIFADEPSWTAGVRFMPETGGLCWSQDGEGGSLEPPGKARHLSIVFRSRVGDPAPGMAVPCSTLPQPLPRSLESSYTVHFFARGDGPEANFRKYCELVIPFHLELYMLYGLALEAHMQNCMVVWSDEGVPRQLWVRDWGGLRADHAVLAKRAPDIASRLDPRSVTLTTEEKARRKLVACLYSNHLTEIVVGLARGMGRAEDDLWRIVREVSARVLGPWSVHPLRASVLEEPWPIKSLLSMRLDPESGDSYHPTGNPLARQR